jgi:hypothetical protein
MPRRVANTSALNSCGRVILASERPEGFDDSAFVGAIRARDVGVRVTGLYKKIEDPKSQEIHLILHFLE